MVGASRSDAAVLMLVGQFADGISTTLLGLVADKLGRVPVFRWGDVGPDSYFNIYQLLLMQKIRQAEESTSGWFPVCAALISLHIQPASGTDLRVRRRYSYDAVNMPWFRCNSRETEMIYYSAFIVVFQFGWAGVQISHLSLITDLTKDEDTRTLLTSVRYSFTVISNLLVYFTTWIFFGVGEEGQQVDREDSDKFRYGVSSCQRSFPKFHIAWRRPILRPSPC